MPGVLRPRYFVIVALERTVATIPMHRATRALMDVAVFAGELFHPMLTLWKSLSPRFLNSRFPSNRDSGV